MNKLKKIFLALTIVFMPFAASASSEQEALDFIKKGIDEMLTEVVTSKVSREEKIKRFEEFFKTYADLETVGKFALARYWKPASEADRKEFMEAFVENTVVTWQRRFDEYSGQTFSFKGTRPSSSGDDIFVDSEMVGGGEQPVFIIWRVRKKGGDLKLIDIIIENASMLQVYRNEYNSFLSQNNGNVKMLAERLRANTKASLDQK